MNGKLHLSTLVSFSLLSGAVQVLKAVPVKHLARDFLKTCVNRNYINCNKTMALREGLLLGIGNPLLDISCTVEPEFLEKYDLQPDNAILADKKHSTLYEELIQKYDVEYIAGGSVQNSFRVAQWILQKPNVAVFFGCVGEDKYSRILEEKSRSDGVNVRYQHTKEKPTGTCGVLITGDGAHRSLVANLAAATLFSIDHIRIAENRKFIEEAEYFYISGYVFAVSPPTIMEVAKHVLENNRILLMNLSAPYISTLFKKPQIEALPYVDILFGNATEATTFAKEHCWDTTDLKEIGQRIVNLPKLNKKRSRVAVITQGHNPVLLFQEDKISEFPVERLALSQVVDTNGAGDAFVGGFLAQFVQKKTLDICIRCGIWAAREIIQRSGCTFEGKPTFLA